MGCAGSRFEALPVTGHQLGLSVIDAIPIKTIERGIIVSFVDKTNFLENFGELFDTVTGA